MLTFSSPIQQNATLSAAERSEQVLLAAAQRGDASAFGELYQMHSEPIYGFCFRRLQDAEEARNLTHVVFLRAWQALPKYQVQGVPFLHWLYRIANHCTTDHLRRIRPTVDWEDEQISAEPNLEKSPTPEQIFLNKERALQIQKALLTLHDPYQQVLILRFQQGLSHAEVADVLGRNVGAVRVLQMRALQALQKALTILGIEEA